MKCQCKESCKRELSIKEDKEKPNELIIEIKGYFGKSWVRVKKKELKKLIRN